MLPGFQKVVLTAQKIMAEVREELVRLRAEDTKPSVHTNRQNQLMRFCEARLREPQRLTRSSLGEEKVRWENTLMGFDRLMWEAMRVEELEKAGKGQDAILCRDQTHATKR